MKKGQNAFVSTGFQAFDISTKDQQRVGIGAAVINAPTPAWIPGLPLRDTNCRCRQLRSPATNPGRLRIWFRRGDVRRGLSGPREGIGRSLRTPDSKPNSSPSLLVQSALLMLRPSRSIDVTECDIVGARRSCNLIKTKSSNA
jgi:hypothetical protein